MSEEEMRKALETCKARIKLQDKEIIVNDRVIEILIAAGIVRSDEISAARDIARWDIK